MSLIEQIGSLAKRIATEFKNIRDILNLPDTTFANQVGVIEKNGIPFLHNFSYGNNGSVTPSGRNIFIGKNAGNFSMGATATSIDHGSYLIGIGDEALSSAVTANWCVAIGYQALKNKTIGGGCYAIGYQSQLANVSGIYNVSLGTWTLFSNVSGGSNVAIGYRGLYNNTDSNNTAIGTRSLYGKIAGGDNLAGGYYSGYNLTSGAQNVLLGSNSALLTAAGGNLASINNSVLIGYGSRADASGQTNQIVIGHSAVGNGSNTVQIGNTSITKVYTSGKIAHADATLESESASLGQLYAAVWGRPNYLAVFTDIHNVSDSIISQNYGQIFIASGESSSSLIINSEAYGYYRSEIVGRSGGVDAWRISNAGDDMESGYGRLIIATFNSADDIEINPGRDFTVVPSAKVAFGTYYPTAKVHIQAGTATAGNAPLKLESGTKLTTPEAGAIEYDGTNLFYTNSTQRRQVSKAPVVVTGKTLNSGSWSLVSGLYEYDLSDANITANSIVDIIPDNASMTVVMASLIQPRTDSSTGSVKVYALENPTDIITVTIIITEKTV